MKITRTRTGLRLSQHGVVISELRTSPGPTHSVFDVLAGLILCLAPRARAGLLGFAGGGMMAPLQALNYEGRIDAVDLDREAYQLFCRHCPNWTHSVAWTHADAVTWLRKRAGRFGLLMEDLSIPSGGDVVKPDISWTTLPPLIRSKLGPNGVGVFNILPPAGTVGKRQTQTIASLFGSARVVDFREFQNRILIVGTHLPSARTLGRQLRGVLRLIRSRQADRIRITVVEGGASGGDPTA